MNNLRTQITKVHRTGNPSKHIFLNISKVSAIMVGICLAGVELIHIASVAEQTDTNIDDFVALDSLIFLFSCLISFWAFRSTNLHRSLRIGQTAEVTFAIGLLIMVVIAIFTAFSKTNRGI